MSKSELEQAAQALEEMATKVQATTAVAVAQLTSKAEAIVDQLHATAQALRDLAAMLPETPAPQR
jgi:hypothetical protein